MFSCELLAGVLLCTAPPANTLPVLPISFDLRSVAGSYQGVKPEPAVLFFFVPEAQPARWSLASIDSQYAKVFAARDQFAPGLTIFPGRIRVRFRFDDAGTYVI